MRNLIQKLSAIYREYGSQAASNVESTEPISESVKHPSAESLLKSLSQIAFEEEPVRKLAEEYDRFKDALTPDVSETIVKTGDEYELRSRTGKNLGKYPTKAGAEKREKQVNYFKHVKESYGVFSILDEEPYAIKTFSLKEDAMAMADRYNQLMPYTHRVLYGNKYVVRNVYESMPQSVPTAQTKIAAPKAPTVATGTVTNAQPNTPKAPGSQNVDPNAARAKQTALQRNVSKLANKGVNSAQGGASLEKADDMQLPRSNDNATNAKIAASITNVLQDPAGAQQLKALTDKYNKKQEQ